LIISFIFLISTISILFVLEALLASGTNIFLNHIFSASLILFSRWIGFLIFQVRDISPIKIVSFGMVLFVLLEMIDAAILRSIPGSSILSPLAILV
jgi:hypothetical protein